MMRKIVKQAGGRAALRGWLLTRPTRGSRKAPIPLSSGTTPAASLLGVWSTLEWEADSTYVTSQIEPLSLQSFSSRQLHVSVTVEDLRGPEACAGLLWTLPWRFLLRQGCSLPSGCSKYSQESRPVLGLSSGAPPQCHLRLPLMSGLLMRVTNEPGSCLLTSWPAGYQERCKSPQVGYGSSSCTQEAEAKRLM